MGKKGHYSPEKKLNFNFSGNLTLLNTKDLMNFNDIPKLDPSKCSIKKSGLVKAFAANTHQGLIRNYNEDRVSIVLNIMKPESKICDKWPSCSLFGIYDGHGGSKCAQFLRDKFHHFV